MVPVQIRNGTIWILKLNRTYRMFFWQRMRYAYLEDEYKVSDELLLWCLWWCWPHPRDRLLLAGSSRQVSWHLEGCPSTPVNLSVLEYGRVGTRSIKDEYNVKLCWKQQNIKPIVAEPEPGLLGRLLRLLFFFIPSALAPTLGSTCFFLYFQMFYSWL